MGNRLVQDSDANGNSVYLEYTYDDANRLATAGEVEYEWDDNGNLLDDGVNEYTYDTANRLLTVSGESLAESFGYNGVGERLEQTVDSLTTEFVVDLNAGLSQVLSDGTNMYTYGLGRISQVNGSGTEYFLGDALGSVRQLADATGAITLARSYEPYGSVEQEVALPGVQSAYGFTSEYTDSNTNLVYLRSRFYASEEGRYLSRDEWNGNANRPLTYNDWLYVSDNPINAADPSGRTSVEECNLIPNPTARQICLSYATCSDLCPFRPNVTLTDPAHKAYSVLANTPCKRKSSGQLYPWWRSLNAEQNVSARMSPTMLVAVLVYTEGAPIRTLAESDEPRRIWIETAINRYKWAGRVAGGHQIINYGSELEGGLKLFLSWSDRFQNGGYGEGQGTDKFKQLYDKGYGEPGWAYSIAQRIVSSSGGYDVNKPVGACNAQSQPEADYFQNAYQIYGKFCLDPKGVYYIWGTGHVKDMIVMTNAQLNTHCKSGHGTMVCGN